MNRVFSLLYEDLLNNYASRTCTLRSFTTRRGGGNGGMGRRKWGGWGRRWGMGAEVGDGEGMGDGGGDGELMG